MSKIEANERYRLVFESHRHSSDFRVTILKGWCAFYAAFAAGYVWVYSNQPNLQWVVPIAAIPVTVLFWLADKRNRVAIHRAKEVGEAIEVNVSNEIPSSEQFFTGLNVEDAVSHSTAIDVFAGVMLFLLLAATIGLRCPSKSHCGHTSESSARGCDLNCK